MNDNAGTAECSSDEMQKIIDGKTPPQTTDYVGTPGSQSGSSSGVQSPEIEAQKALRDAEYKLAQAQKNYDQCWWGCADEKAALEQAQQTRDAVQDSADYLNEIANKPPGTYIPETPLNTALQNSWANNVLQQPAPAVTESRLGDFGSGLREALSPDSFSNSAFRDQWNGWNPNVTPSDGAFNRFDFGNNSGFNSFGQSVGSDISGGLSAGPSSFTPFSFDSGLTGSPYDGSAPFEPFDYETSPIGPGWGNDDLGKLSNFDFSNAPLQPSTLQDLSNLNNGLLPTLPSVSDPLGALKSLDSEQLPTVSDAQSPNDFLGLKAIAEQQPPEGSGLSAEDFSERLEVFKKGFGNVVDSLTEGVQGIFAGDISAPDFWDKTLKNIGVGVNAGLGEGGVRLGGILDYSPLSDGGLLPGLRQTVKDVFGWGSDVATPPEIPSGIQGGGALTAGESYRRELDAAKQASAAAGERARRADENARSTGSYDPDNAFEVERYNAAQAEIKAAREEQAAAQARLAAAQADVDRIRARDNQVPGQGSIANTGVNEAKVVADSGVRDTQGTESLAYQRAAKDYQALLPLAAPVTNALQDANSAWIKRAEEIGLIENIGTADKPQYRIRPELTETQRINKMGMLRDETDRLNLAKDQYKTYAETLKDARDKTLYAAGADPLFSDAARANALLGDMRLRPEQEIPIDEYWQDKNGLAMGVGAAGAMGRYVLRMDPYQPVINSNAQEIAFNELQAKQEALIQSLAGCTDCQNVIEAIERNNELAKQFESGQFEGAQKDYLIKLSDQNPIQRDLPVGDLTTQELASRASNEWGRLLRGTQEYLGAEMGKAWEEGEYGKATALFLLQTPGQITQGLLGAESLQGLGQTLYGADTSILGLTIPGGEAGYNIVRNVTDAGTLSVVTGAYLFPGPAGLALRGADSLAASAGRFAGNIADVRSALNVADSGAGFGYDFSGRPSADAIIRDGGLAVVPENNISTAPARDGGSSPPPQLTSNAPSPTSRSVTQPPPLRNEFSPTGGARTSGNAVQGAPPSASFIPGTSPLGDLADAMRRGSPTLITPSNFGRTGDDVLFGGAANDNLMGSTPAGGPPLENRWFAFARAPEDGGGAGRGGTIIPFTPRASELPSVGGGDTIVFREGFGSDAPPARVDAGAIDDATLRELENILANEPDQFVFRTVDDAVTPDGVTDLLQRRYGGASLEEIAKAREAIRLNEAARRLDSQNTSQATADASTLRARAAQIATDINDPALGRLAESWGGERAPSAAGAGVPDSVVAAEAAQPKPASGILSPITNTPFARALCVIGGLFCGSQAVPGQLVNDLNPLGISSANAKPAALPVQLVHDGVLGVETGAASTYNPNVVGWRTGGEKLATGGRYNPDEFEAALQTGLAEQYRMGHSRYPNVGYALVEAEGRKLIVRINDNGPLVRNRIIDLNEASMRYLSGGRYGNNSGVLQNTRVTVLAGQNYTPGPLANDATLLARAEIPPASPTAPRIETGSLSAPKSAVDSAVDEITKRAEQVGDAVRKAGDDLAKALDIRPGTPETDFMKNVQGKLVETPPPAALIKNFDVNNHTSAEARAVQEALRAQGYDTAVDGVIGPQTIRALESARVDIDGALRNIFTDQADYQQARRIFLERFKGMPKNFEQPLLTMLRKMQEAGQALPGDNQPIVLVNVSGSREGVAIMSLTHNDGLLLWEGSPTLRVGVAANGPIDWAKDFIGSNKTIVGSVAKIIGGEHRGDKAWAVGALYRESIDGGLQNERVTWYHGVSNRAVTPGQRPNATSGCVSMCSLVMQNLYDQVLGTPGVGEPGWQLAGRDGAVRGANKINGGYTYEFSEQVTNSVGVAENKAIAQKEPVMVADAAPGGGATQGLTPETAEIARVYEISGETGTIPKGAILEVSPDGKTLTYGETVYQAKQISGEPIPLEPASALSIIDLKPLQVDWLDRIQIEGVPKLGLELQVWRPDFNAAVENVMRGVNDGISEFKQIVSGVPGDISKWVSRNSFNVSVSLEPNPAWLKAVGDSANTAAERITIMYRDAYAALDDFPSAPPTPGDPLFGLFALGSTRRTSNAPSQTPIPEGVDTPPAGLGLQAPPSKIAGTGDTQKFVPTSRNI
ncbi:MAG: hypothetical protein HYT30_01150, partial [Parcubacteria group bacterium]|nr:hypothetical protein [Parcubacteria group bacterium]